MLRWPDRGQVDRAARAWAEDQRGTHPEIVQLGYFGSYARGDWGVGSDLDLVAVVRDGHRPFEQRGLGWDLSALPVPAEILVYRQDEWDRLQAEGGRFAAILRADTRWL